MIIGMAVAVAAAFHLGQKITPQIEHQPIVLPVFKVEVIEKKLELPVPGVPGACRLIDQTSGFNASSTYDCETYLLIRRDSYHKICDKKDLKCRTI